MLQLSNEFLFEVCLPLFLLYIYIYMNYNSHRISSLPIELKEMRSITGLAEVLLSPHLGQKMY